MSTPDAVSLRKGPGSDTGSYSDKERDPEKVANVVDDASSEQANVGLHEFAVAKELGLRVTQEENRR